MFIYQGMLLSSIVNSQSNYTKSLPVGLIDSGTTKIICFVLFCFNVASQSIAYTRLELIMQHRLNSKLSNPPASAVWSWDFGISNQA